MRPRPLALPALLAALATPAAAQDASHGAHDPHPSHAQRRPTSSRGGSGATFSLGAQGVGVVTRVAPAFVGNDFTEGYLSQPALVAHAGLLDGRIAFQATLDFEGLTLERGELTPGIYGEGYVDRRHPHTYTHEVMATLSTERDAGEMDAAAPTDAMGALMARLGARPTRSTEDRPRFAASLATGKGFAPFGTDDPMMRPFEMFPVNHHLSQILERIVLIGAARAGPLMLEGGVFNGDEPVAPGVPPNWSRFGDSWAGRLTLAPRGGALDGLELQGSHAWLTSPEFAAGGGSDQRKWSASARIEHGDRSRTIDDSYRYALVEWARTDDVVDGRRAFTFTSFLAEGAAAWRSTALALRVERTVRPEEERLLDPFRSARPHTDASILGRTRWDVATAHVSLPWKHLGPWRMEPFVELSHARPTALAQPSPFEPARFYGAATQWSYSGGMRVEIGTIHPRMGRYGVARGAGHAAMTGGYEAGSGAPRARGR